MTTITIPASVTSIGDNAFENATSLTTVTFEQGSNLDTIGYSAFLNATALTTITIPASVTSIGSSAFRSTTSLTNITIPSGITTISQYTFNHSGLTSITIPASVTEIAKFAFATTRQLTEVIFESTDTLEIIGNGAFSYTSALTSITIPTSVTYIDNGAFNNSALTSITIPPLITRIGTDVFRLNKFTSITIPANVTSIGDRAFYGATSLTTVTFEANSTLSNNGIGVDAFAVSGLINIYAYQSVITGQSWDVYGPNEVGGKTGVTVNTANLNFISDNYNGDANFTIPNTFTSIEYDAFDGVTSLTSITIPNSIISIGYNSFRNTTNLTTVIFEENSTLNTIANTYGVDEGAFRNSGLSSINIPASVTSIGAQAFRNSGLSSINIPIPASVTSIGGQAFQNTAITTITIPASVTSIGAQAFLNATSLSEVIFDSGSSLNRIDQSAFRETSLISVTIPDSVTIIERYAFQNISELTSITIGNSVTSIGPKAFAGSNFKSIIIPSSVTSIATNVFEDSGLEYIFVPSTLIDNQWDIGVNTNSVYGKEGVIVLINIDDINVTLVKNSSDNEILLMSENNYNQVSQSQLATVQFYVIEPTGNIERLEIDQNNQNKCIYTGPRDVSGSETFRYYYTYDVDGLTLTSITKTVYVTIIDLDDYIDDINDEFLRNSSNNEIILMSENDYIYLTGTGTVQFYVIEPTGNIERLEIDQNNQNKCIYTGERNFSGSGTFHYYYTYNGARSSTKTVYITIVGITVTNGNKHIYSTKTVDSLGNVELGFLAEVDTIGSSAFMNDDTINIVVFEYNINNIRTAAFRNVANLHSIIFRNGVDTIGDSAFYFTNVSKITYDNKDYFIDSDTLEIPTSITSIGGLFNSQTHFYSDGTNNILLPSSAFVYKNLHILKLPNSLLTIGYGAFRFSKLTSLVLPKFLNGVEFHAFYGNNVQNLFVSNNLSTLFYGSFNENNIINYYVYDNSTKVVYIGDLEELSKRHDYEPLVVATTTIAKMTEIAGLIIPLEMLSYPDYISSKKIINEYNLIEDTLLNINIQSETDSSINIVEQPRGDFIFNHPYVYFTPLSNSNDIDGFIYEEIYTDNSDGIQIQKVKYITAFINIIPENDVPISYSVDISTNEDTSIQVDFSYNDIDSPINDLSYVIVSHPNSGVLTNIVGNKLAILYTPANNFFGDVSFTYSISDTKLVSNVSTVNIQVFEVNDPPIVYDISKTIFENSEGFSHLITYQDIDSSDSTITYHIYNQPEYGSATFSNNILNYIPDPDYYGIDSLQYYVMDEDLSSNVGNINITILEEIFTPQVFDLKIQTNENEKITFSLNNYIDEGTINDLSFVFVNNVKNGSLTKTGGQTFVYEPNYHFYGGDSFSYYLYAPPPNNTESIVATVSINVLSVPYAGCILCPPKVIFERNNNTYFNASGKIHVAHKNIRNEGRGCNTFVSQTPAIIVPPKNKF